MCLYTQQAKPYVAKKNIYVFKVLAVFKSRSGKSIVKSPYRWVPYEIGHLYSADIGRSKIPPFRPEDSKDVQEYQIAQGLHSFSNYGAAKECATYSFVDNRYIFVAKIPKGASYYRGECGEQVVSDKLVVLDRRHPESLKRLRISKHYS